MAKAAKKPQMGRPSMFKKDGPDIHGQISEAAGVKFEQHRVKLAALYKSVTGAAWKGQISDGAVIEYLTRGEVSTKLVFKGEL